MSEAIREQIQSLGLSTRLATTAEAAKVTGLSEYELRLGAKEGRYPVLMIGRNQSNSRRMRWDIEILLDAIRKQMQQPEG